jgi:hypothetical protein
LRNHFFKSAGKTSIFTRLRFFLMKSYRNHYS